MRFEDAIAEHYQGKSSPIDPGLLDKDFDICIKARAAMTQPCTFLAGEFCGAFTSQFGKYIEVACWGGHLLQAAGERPGKYLLTTYQCVLLNRIAKKLGFVTRSDIYTFNDTHSHPEVIREFDRRLQLWT